MDGEHVNVEIKAACDDPRRVRAALRAAGAECRGTDRQVDTYFRVPRGRLKLREGDIENHLIHYDRPDTAGPKRADVLLADARPGGALKALLARALGTLVVVSKRREIWLAGNVKLHVDEVDGLGSFVEIEARAPAGERGEAELLDQCRLWMARLDIRDEHLIDRSYSDLLADRGDD